MVGIRVGPLCMGGKFPVPEKAFAIPVLDRVCQPVIKLFCPRLGWRTFAERGGRVAERVDRPAASHDKDALVPQFRDRLSHGKVPGRVKVALNGEWTDRDIRVREHQHHGDPGPVVEAAGGIGGAGDARTSRRPATRPARAGLPGAGYSIR